MAGNKGSKRSSSASTASASLASAKLARPRLSETSRVGKLSPSSGNESSDEEKDPPIIKADVNTPPKLLFMSDALETKTLETELTVSTLVGLRVFPHMKFINDPRIELMYNLNPKSICGVVLETCSPPANVSSEEWWEHARKWIGRNVSVLRSSKNTQMKWSFMGKWMQCVH
jgi:hypothetical protein